MVRDYDYKDYNQISSWFHAWGIKPIPEEMLPKLGAIVDSVAVGFLYQTDSDMAVLDSYLSNPKAEKEDKNLALDAITDLLITKAKQLGFTVIKCDTTLETIKYRAKKFGFKENGHYWSYVKGV